MLHLSFGLLRVRRPLGSTLFPYTTLFRSRIFYRNSVDGGFLIPFESFEDLSKEVETGDELEIDQENHILKNITRNKEYPIKSLGSVADIVNAGGICKYARANGMVPQL